MAPKNKEIQRYKTKFIQKNILH